MSDQKPILASAIWDAFPHNDLLDVEEPHEGETVDAYIERVQYCCDCGNRDILGGDSVFQYVMYAARDARGDGMQFLTDLIRGAADLNSVAQDIVAKLR